MASQEKHIVITSEDLELEQAKNPPIERIVITAHELPIDGEQPSNRTTNINRAGVSELSINPSREYQAQHNNLAIQKYAGFWIRFLAALIDGFIMNIAAVALAFVIGIAMGTAMAFSEQGFKDGNFLLYFSLSAMVTQFLYFSLLESSSWRATVGKRLLGIIVTDEHGKRISFLRACSRYLAKFISALILCIGYLMVAFTAKKQGLHDKMAATLVLKK